MELGNPAEARAELAQIGAGRQFHPDVLEVRWLICAEEQRWDEGLQAARALLQAAPERASGWLHQSYALRRVAGGGVRQAKTRCCRRSKNSQSSLSSLTTSPATPVSYRIWRPGASGSGGPWRLGAKTRLS